MKKENLYYGVIVVLLTTLLLFVKVSNDNFTEMLETNKNLIETIEIQRKSHYDVVDQYEKSYKELEHKYSELLRVNSELQEKLQEQVNKNILPVYKFTPSEVYMLAQCVEAEAGHYAKHKNSQKYITQVILNRLKSGKFPNTLEKVIYQKRGNIPQFSVAYNGMMDRKVEPETLSNVYSVIVHGTDLPDNVLYFYSSSVKENWVNTLNTYDVVEGTVFAYEK